MKIADLLSETAISTSLKARDKKGVIRELVDLLVRAGEVEKGEELFRAVMEREKLGSTGIGHGIAIPHAKVGSVKELVASFACSEKGVPFDSLDGAPAFLFFLLVAPQDSAGPHLKALARISRLLKEASFRKQLRDAKTPSEVVKIIKREEEKRG